MTPIEQMDPKTAEQVWKIAGRVEWTVDDWKTFYWAITRAFAEIAYRHAVTRLSPVPTESSGQ